MFEKVNPSHPDKVADRIAGAIVDLAYEIEGGIDTANPKIAVEVLIGHGSANVIVESSLSSHKLKREYIAAIIDRICPGITDERKNIIHVSQDEILAKNQEDKIKAGDNGIFSGYPVSLEQRKLTKLVRELYKTYPCDGKFIINDNKLTICQSNVEAEVIPYVINFKLSDDIKIGEINPLGYWLGGIDVDSGATNRKLGSDMGDAVTGGGLHGKDLSKADVSVNIYAHMKAQRLNRPVHLCCNIGQEIIDGIPYERIVEKARQFIINRGGFEKFAEYGLIY